MDAYAFSAFDLRWRSITLKASEKNRLKALTCEKLVREATDQETEAAWTELAIEWHIFGFDCVGRERHRFGF